MAPRLRTSDRREDVIEERGWCFVSSRSARRMAAGKRRETMGRGGILGGTWVEGEMVVMISCMGRSESRLVRSGSRVFAFLEGFEVLGAFEGVAVGVLDGGVIRLIRGKI